MLCTPGLRPWIKGGDIQPKVFGSDHCPVHIDLHEEITVNGEVLKLKDQLNPPNRPKTTATLYPTDVPRGTPEPPRFATKFLDEFSGRQTTLKSFFSKPGMGKTVSASASPPQPSPVPPSPSPAPSATTAATAMPAQTQGAAEEPSTPMDVARAAFSSIESGSSQPRAANSNIIDLTDSKAKSTSASASKHIVSSPTSASKNKVRPPEPKGKPAKPVAGQTRLSSFFTQPQSQGTSAKRRRSSSIAEGRSPSTNYTPPRASRSPTASTLPASVMSPDDKPSPSQERDEDEEAMIAQAIAEADAAQALKKAKTNANAAPVWSNLFAKKLPPLCTVHQKPCKDFSESPWLLGF